MSTSATVIAALKFESGVVIAADTQASDPIARVRWPVEKLDRIGQHPLIIGFSGAIGLSQRAWSALDSSDFRTTTFEKRDRVRDAMDRCLNPIYTKIINDYPQPRPELWHITIWGLAAYWAENQPHIIEYGPNGIPEFHPHFHAIGSGANTAYAIWRTLGGPHLAKLGGEKSLQVILRIIRTCVDVEMVGVSEPITLWVVSANKTRKVSPDEMETLKQYVCEWEEKERKEFFGS